MVRLATVAAAHFCGRVRRRFAHHAHDPGLAESFRLLPSKWAYTVRDRSPQRRSALAAWFSPAGEPKGMGLQSAESISISAVRSLYLSPRYGDHSRLVANVFRVRQISEQTVFCPRAGDRAITVCR